MKAYRTYTLEDMVNTKLSPPFLKDLTEDETFSMVTNLSYLKMMAYSKPWINELSYYERFFMPKAFSKQAINEVLFKVENDPGFKEKTKVKVPFSLTDAMLTRMNDAKIANLANIERDIRNLRADALDRYTQYEHSMLEATKKSTNIAMLKASIASSLTSLRENLQSIAESGDWVFVGVKESESIIFITSRPLVMKYFVPNAGINHSLNIGYWLLKIYPSEVRLQPAFDSPFLSGSHYHPHVSSSYKPCFGDKASAVIDALSICDYGLVADICHALLQQMGGSPYVDYDVFSKFRGRIQWPYSSSTMRTLGIGKEFAEWFFNITKDKNIKDYLKEIYEQEEKTAMLERGETAAPPATSENAGDDTTESPF